MSISPELMSEQPNEGGDNSIESLLTMSRNVLTFSLNDDELCDSIPVLGDYNYFTAFPEFTSMCNFVKTQSISGFQCLFDLVLIGVECYI